MRALLATLLLLLAHPLEARPLHGGVPPSGGAHYVGYCDIVGCAEAYGISYSSSQTYLGPLFQITRTTDHASLDIGQASGHADTSTWPAFCGESLPVPFTSNFTSTHCYISKFYAEINPGQAPAGNDLVPSVFSAPFGPNCSAGGLTCAAPLTIEAATGLPILVGIAPQEYTLAGDNASTGINSGSNAISIIYNGQPVAATLYCCGVFGMTHPYNGADNLGTDFMIALAYGRNSLSILVNCGSTTTYCAGAEEESVNDLADYGSSPKPNALVIINHDPAANAVSTWLNASLLFTHSPPASTAAGFTLNPGQQIHLCGGGDLSQPAPCIMREAIILNTAITSTQQAAVYANTTARYPTLMFP